MLPPGSLNIMYMLPELNVGGVETHVLALAFGMKQFGHNVTVVSNGGALVRRLEQGGIEHITLPIHHKSPWTVNDMARRVRGIVAEREIHVVHAHSRVPAWIAHFATRNTNTAFIITAHGQYAPHWGSRVMAWGDHIIAVSRIIMEHMAVKLNADRSRMEVVYNGIDIDEALEILRNSRDRLDMRRELGVPEDAPLVGAIGRLTATKGLRYFLDALAMLIEKRPEVRALFVGDGQLRKEHEDQARDLGISSNVIFTGVRSDIYDILNTLDMYVVSSLYEGFPMGCLEALSGRVPIVATRVGGIPEMLADGETALLADARNAQQLFENMDRMLGDAELRNRLTEKGFETVTERFSRSNMLQEILGIYERVLRERYGRFRPASVSALKDRPRMLLALPELRVGGVETHVIDLACGLKLKGYEPVVSSYGGKLTEKLQAAGITHITLPIHSKSPFMIGAMVTRMRRLIEEHHIDLVHAHSRVPAWICYMALRSMGSSMPFITTCHSTYSVHVGSRVMNWGNALIAVSAFVRQHMLSNFGTRPDRITTVYNGVSPDLYDPERSRAMSEKYRRELGIGQDTPVVGMVASLTPRKGYTYFISAAENIIRQYPDAVFLGVGGGVQQDELEALVRDRRLDGRFRFLGVRQDVRDLMCAFDIFVLSSMSEGLPYVILEAMCMKKPVVSSSVGGIPEAVEHGKNGLLVPPRDTEALTQSILTLLENPEMARAMGDASHHLIAETFNVQRMVDSTEQIYAKVFS